jgi:exonuclease SbcD
LYRSKVSPSLVRAALEPLLEVADTGVPVLLVPGNHERSALPYPLLASHQHLHVFDRARTFVVDVGDARVAAAGFPCERDRVRHRFSELVASTGAADAAADVRLLCLHQTVEGAAVENHIFRTGDDVIRGRDIPEGFAAVLCGHIHRAQVLTRGPAGQKSAVPVLYPGSVERTSFAERHEPKGFMILEFEPDAEAGGRLVRWELRELPTRPMAIVTIDASSLDAVALEDGLRREIGRLPDDAVVQVRITGELSGAAAEALRAENVRRIHPPSMTVTLQLGAGRRW